jgi:HD-like signal output (HDOD) protein
VGSRTSNTRLPMLKSLVALIRRRTARRVAHRPGSAQEGAVSSSAAGGHKVLASINVATSASMGTEAAGVARPGDPALAQLLTLYPELPRLTDEALPADSNGGAGSAVNRPSNAASQASWQAIGEVECAFSAALLGCGDLEDSPCRPWELGILDAIHTLATGGNDPDLPRLPRVLPQLLSLARRDDVGAREFSETLSHDPGLVAEVLQLANSPRYRGEHELKRLDDAVARLGQQGLQQLVTQVALRPIYSTRSGHFSKLAGTRLWALSERCAHAATYLNSGEGEHAGDPFSAYLAGLMAHVGTMASLRVLDHASALPQPPSGRHLNSLSFHRGLIAANARLSGRLAQHWDLPASVVTALRRRGSAAQAQALGLRAEADRTPFPPMAAALCVADRASQMHLLGDVPSDAALVTSQGPGTVALARCLHELDRAFAA